MSELNIKRRNSIRKRIIDMAYSCGESSHLGGALSMVDILTALYSDVLDYDPNNLLDANRDIFILSKGHCVLGWFATLVEFGAMSERVFETFQQNGSDLIAHPVKNLELGIESSNGSLGQGLSFGLGMALGMRKKSQNRRVFVLMGDGECNEGAVWEAAATASELELDNLIAIVDVNGLRNDGENRTYRAGASLPSVWRAFGWSVLDVDGHDLDSLKEALTSANESIKQPKVVLANTVKGAGIQFMENNNEWHHNRVTTSIHKAILEEWGVSDV